MKTYVLIVSRVFPKTHKRAGEPTNFREKILEGEKIHTIRANYHLWAKRVEEVQRGEAIIAIRYWSGKPYNSKQLRICELDKNSGVGMQELRFYYDHIDGPYINTKERHIGYIGMTSLFSKNDGLSLDDFKEWFKGYDLSKPLALIHFTKFRY
jgi:hypothetical protein